MFDAPIDHILQCRIELEEVDLPIWRRVLVPSALTFDDLHRLIQIVMPWDNAHLHQFQAEDGTAIDPDPEEVFRWRRPVLASATTPVWQFLSADGDRARYVYDFCDGWIHRITVETIRAREPDVTYPTLLSGMGAAPPEDCGGVWTYNQIVSEYDNGSLDDELVEWLPASFDPHHFALQTHRYLLENIFTRQYRLADTTERFHA